MAFHHSPRIITDGLVLSLDAADKNSYIGSGTTWSDLSPNGNDGTLTNGPTFNSGVGGSIIFDGANDYVNLNSDYEDWVESAHKTCCVWFLNGGNTSEARIFNAGFDDTSSKTAFAIGVKASTNNSPFYFLRTAAGATLKADFGDVMNTTDWNYLCLVHDGTANEGYCYQQGVLKTTVSNVGEITQATSDTAALGVAWFDHSSYHLDGNIACLQLYNRALSAAEILQNYNAHRHRFGV
jgi:hypothetical protein